MGGSFGGMMWRVASSLGMSGHSYERTYRTPVKESVLDSTANTLGTIKKRHEQAREKAVYRFEKALLDNQDVLYAAGLLKEGDTLYKILCRVAGKKYRKPKTRKSR